MTKKTKIFLDGGLVAVDSATLDSLSPGKIVGKGVFETMLSKKGRIFQLEEHLQRLFQGLRVLKIQSPLTRDQMKKDLITLLRFSLLSKARVRIVVWQNQGRVRTALMMQPYRPFSARKYREGFKALMAGERLRRSLRWSSVKSLEYQIFLRVYHVAQSRGCDEAILLNGRGFLAEGSRSNIFFVKDDVLYTPSLSCGCLDGVTRRMVLKIARQLKLKVKEANVRPEELSNADEAFLTNSLMGVMPLSELNGRLIASGRVGPVTLRILKSCPRVFLS